MSIFSFPLLFSLTCTAQNSVRLTYSEFQIEETRHRMLTARSCLLPMNLPRIHDMPLLKMWRSPSTRELYCVISLVYMYIWQHRLICYLPFAHPAPNTPLPIIGPIQWTWGYIVQAKMNKPIVTSGAPAIAVDLKKSNQVSQSPFSIWNFSPQANLNLTYPEGVAILAENHLLCQLPFRVRAPIAHSCDAITDPSKSLWPYPQTNPGSTTRTATD